MVNQSGGISSKRPLLAALPEAGAALTPLTLQFSTSRQQRRIPLAIKGGFDRSFAAVALVSLMPLLLLIAGAIRLDSRGPVIFSQRRYGLDGRIFLIRKFRTLGWTGSTSGAVQITRGDRRITRIGAMLRSTSLDELPQLWNILAGSMSLVGPRPHPIDMRTEGRLGEEIAPGYVERLRMKPGLTGLAQINGHRGPAASAAELRARIGYDLAYVAQWSLLLDLRIVLITPVRLITQREHAF